MSTSPKTRAGTSLRFACTHGLLVRLFLMFGIELAMGAIGNDARLVSLGAIPDTAMVASQYWRVLTYAWLHASYLHLAMNGGLLFWVGRIVERRIGSVAMLVVFLACALLGGVLIAANASLHPKPGASLGASAGIFGLLTCGLVLLFRPGAAHFGQPLWVRITLCVILVGGLAASALPGVSLIGHVGGLILGTCLGLVVSVQGSGKSPATEGA